MGKKKLIPLPLLFTKPKRDQLRLSPLGGYLGWRARGAGEENDDDDDGGGVLNIWVRQRSKDGDHDNEPPRQVTFATDIDACTLFFFSTDDRTLLYLRETTHGSELYHLYAVDLDDDPHVVGGSRDLLAACPDTTCALGFGGNVQLWMCPSRPREVYAGTQTGTRAGLFWDVSRIHLDTCDVDVVERNIMSTWVGFLWFLFHSVWSLVVCPALTLGYYRPAPLSAPIQWFPDREMCFRGRLGVTANLCGVWSVRPRPVAEPGPTKDDHNHNNWRTLQTISFDDFNMQLIGSTGGSGTMHMHFAVDDDTVDVHTCHREGIDTTSYERFHVVTGAHVTRLAHSDKSDIAGFVTHPVTKSVQGVCYDYEKPTTVDIMEGSNNGGSTTIKADLEFLRHSFPGMSFTIQDRTLDDATWVVYAESDRGQAVCGGCPNAYFLYSRPQQQSETSTPNLTMVFSPRPQLAKYELGTMTPVHVSARDGQDLLCYLSAPSSSATNSPLVVLPHGGPQARDTWGYDPLCQLLTNRGMYVLQVNYRGSTGFGTGFLRAGMQGAFATTVQEDVGDVVRCVVRDYDVDPDRVAVVGFSFGGYCALFGMTLQKEINYACAVAVCPPSVVGAAAAAKRGFRGDPLAARYWSRVYGKAVTENVAEARRVSPLYHLDKLRAGAPVLLVHGTHDPRVPISHSDDMVDAMRRRLTDGDDDGGLYVRFEGEGHGIRREPNTMLMYHEIERFLCRHLKLLPPGAQDVESLEDVWTAGHSATILYVKDEDTKGKTKES